VSITKWHPAKTAGLIEMLFGTWGGVGPSNPSNHVLDGGLDPPGEGAFLGWRRDRPTVNYSLAIMDHEP